MRSTKKTGLTRLLLASAVSAACLLHTPQASAMGILHAYEAALRNDPVFRSAMSENLAGKENRIIGRVGLLPSIQYSYTASKNSGETTQPNVLGVPKTSDNEYTSINSVISVRQTLFNLDATSRFKQGIAQTKYSDSVFTLRSYDLMIRVVSAYAEAKYAEDQLILLSTQRDSYAEQKRVNDRMFEKGEGTVTDKLETQAKLDVAEAQVIEAADNLINTRSSLAGMIGREVIQLDNLAPNFTPIPLSPSGFEEWQEIANSHNSEMAAGRFNVEIAELEISKSKAGHAPRLDLNANYSETASESLITRNQNTSNRSIGVQLVIPIYSGGYISAVSRQTVATRDKAKSDLDATTNKVMLELRKQFNALKSSVAKIEALQKSVNSATLLVEATKQSVKGGVRINLDVLNVQQQLVLNKRDLAAARYSYLTSYLKLRVAAGILNLDDLRTVAGFFTTDN